jgi:hypothetical protein
MTYFKRPDQIKLILNRLSSDKDAEAYVELENYLSELEAEQPAIPAHIVAILNSLEADYPADVSTTLEAYISRLELTRQLSNLRDVPVPAAETRRPIWSHQRFMEREQHQRERALRKQNNYQ